MVEIDHSVFTWFASFNFLCITLRFSFAAVEQILERISLVIFAILLNFALAVNRAIGVGTAVLQDRIVTSWSYTIDELIIIGAIRLC